MVSHIDLGDLVICMPSPFGAEGIMFPGCPSARLKPFEVPSFCPCMGPLVHQTNPDRFSVCISGEVSGHFLEIHRGNDLKFCMLMYPSHLRKWLDYGHGLLSFPILVAFYLVKRVKFGGSGHFRRTHRGNGLKFCMFMYPDHLQN